MPQTPGKSVRTLLPETIVFDLDGTLIDTAPDLTSALNAVLTRQHLPELPLAQVRQMVGRGARVLIENALASHQIATDPQRTIELEKHFIEFYNSNIAVASRPFEGMEDTIRQLASKGHKIGICTNKPEYLSRKLLAELKLEHLFPAVLGADSRPYRKPDPRHLFDTIAALGGDRSNAVLVGDSQTDALTAHAANIPVILVTFGYTETPVSEMGAAATIDHFRELEAALSLCSRA